MPAKRSKSPGSRSWSNLPNWSHSVGDGWRCLPRGVFLEMETGKMSTNKLIGSRCMRYIYICIYLVLFFLWFLMGCTHGKSPFLHYVLGEYCLVVPSILEQIQVYLPTFTIIYHRKQLIDWCLYHQKSGIYTPFTLYGCFLKWWYPTTMGFLLKMIILGCFGGTTI